jgi:hypothetical protein
MADAPATNVDTTGATGNTGAAPVGAAPTTGSNADTEGTVPGGAPNPAAPAAANVDTTGVGGPNKPENYTPTSVLLGGTIDTASSDGNVIRQANPAYRAPAAYVSAGTVDTTRTDSLGLGPAPTATQSLSRARRRPPTSAPARRPRRSPRTSRSTPQATTPARAVYSRRPPSAWSTRARSSR